MLEIVSFLTTKPIVLLMEIFFMIFGRLYDTGIVVLFVCFFVNLFLVPLFLMSELKVSKSFSEDSAGKSKINVHGISFLLLEIILYVLYYLSGYSFFSDVEIIQGAKFGFLPNLGKPNLILPFVFLAISVLSTFVFKKRNLICKLISLCISFMITVGLFFAPSGLGLFWIVFSLFFFAGKYLLDYLIVGISLEKIRGKGNYFLFFSGILYLILLTGCFIPSNIIKVSPAEFVNALDVRNPLRYIFYTSIFAIGTFGFWVSAYYILAGEKIRAIFDRIIWIICCIAFVNYMIAGSAMGEVSPALFYFEFDEFETVRIIISFAASIAIAVLVWILVEKKKEIVMLIIAVEMGILLFSVVTNILKINKVYAGLDYINSDETTTDIIPLSRTGKNVVVLIIDRALGSEVLYIFNEKPELKEQFDGFTYYRNTVSFGGFTNTGMPAVYGGYEYTPDRMNLRTEESLAEKHDEALKVMPVLFDENDFEVTVCDPVYAGYNWIPDLSIYDDYPEIRTFNTHGRFSASAPEDYVGPRESLKRNFFVHSLMKIVPLNWQFLLYNDGQYCNPNFNYVKGKESIYQSEGYDSDFMDSYLVLKNLPQMSFIQSEKENTFLIMYNKTPHMPCLLQEPEYEPRKIVDNREYYSNPSERFALNGEILPMETKAQVNHYDVNMATYLQIGKWLDYLKENDCYDNTRIIIVSDHGRDVHYLETIDGSDVEVEFFMPVLLVKDFGSAGFKTSEELMTNADVAELATKDLIENPVNPFTENLLNRHEKKEESFTLFFSTNKNPQDNPGNVFEAGDWFSLSGSPYDMKNWKYLGYY